MAKKMKKIFSLILALSMVMSLLSVMASAEGGTFNCGKEAHAQHDDMCYELQLKCDKHAHDEACYADGELTCTGKNLICAEEHEHGGVCYEEHTHGEDCYESVQICEKEIHVHDEACSYVAKIGEVPYETLTAAVAAANADAETEGAVVINLIADTTFNKAMTISRDITITGAKTLTRADSYTGKLFTVASGATLTLDGGMVIDGGNDWTFNSAAYYADMQTNEKSVSAYATPEAGAPIAKAIMIDISGNVVMNKATIRNNYSSNNNSNSNAFYLFNVKNGASLTMTGALITDNCKVSGSSLVANVEAGGKWTINDGTVISDNYHGEVGNGGISYVKGLLTMNGGLVCNNTGFGGTGVFVMVLGSAGKMVMNGGTICHNAVFGTGGSGTAVIYVHKSSGGGTFEMNGGVIENNYSYNGSGLAANGDESKIYLNGGVIKHTATIGNGYTSYGRGFTFGKNMVIDEAEKNDGLIRIFSDVVNDGVINSTVHLWASARGYHNFSGTGVVKAPVKIGRNDTYMGTAATFESGTWAGDAGEYTTVYLGSSLTVGAAATINNDVEVFASVDSETGDSADSAKASAAQSAAFINNGTVTGDVRYYHRLLAAQKKNIVVTYDYNGGRDAQNWSGIQRTSAEEAYVLEPLPTPTRAGYVLQGWTVESTGEAYVEGTAATADMTLVAQWDPLYTVTYQYSGEVPEGAPALPEAKDYLAGSDITIADAPTLSGYTFSGWDADPALVDGKMPASDVTISGSWAARVVRPPVDVNPPAGDPSGENPGEDITNPDVPMEETPAEDDNEEVIEEEDIIDPDAPLADAPVEDEVIEEEDIPMADVPETGDMTALWAAASVVSAAGVLFLGKKNKDEE